MATLAVGTLQGAGTEAVTGPGDIAGLVLDALQRARARAGNDALVRRLLLDAVALDSAQSIGEAPHADRLVVGEAVETRLRASGIDGFSRVTEYVALERGDADPATRFVSGWYGYKSSWKQARSDDYDAVGLATFVAADGWTVLVAILVQDAIVPYVAHGAAGRGNAPEIDLRALERDVAAAVNEVRRDKGLSILTFDEELAAIAREHSEDMSDRDFFSHFSPEGNSPRDRVEQNGLSFRKMGENLQMSRGDREPVKGAIDSWMKSRGHRKTMLTSEFRATGVGVARNAEGAFYFTQLFRFVADESQADGQPTRP